MPACALRPQLPAFYSGSKTLTQKPHTHVFPSHMVVIVYMCWAVCCWCYIYLILCTSNSTFCYSLFDVCKLLLPATSPLAIVQLAHLTANQEDPVNQLLFERKGLAKSSHVKASCRHHSLTFLETRRSIGSYGRNTKRIHH